MSTLRQIETRNRNVYFELQKFPLETEIREAPIGEPKKVQKNEARLSKVRSMCTDRRLDGYDMARWRPDDIHREGRAWNYTTGGKFRTHYKLPTCAGRRKEKAAAAIFSHAPRLHTGS
jgi:hypothetical protein